MNANPWASAAAPGRILIVDDERANTQLLEVMLGAEGFQIASAASGEKALAALTRQLPDLILPDALIPGSSGFDVADPVKKAPVTSNKHGRPTVAGGGVNPGGGRP